jgi:dipeptidyl aminopeptidase/acylaminoacyl peptidase
MDDPTMPIVAMDGKESNDTYVEQLVASAEAAVDHLVTMGVADRDRIAVGGHSYGAFMTANLLAHTSIFRAGIARSARTTARSRRSASRGSSARTGRRRTSTSACRRSRTPTRSRRRSCWCTGWRTTTPARIPIQSERMYAALKGNGGTARYVQLPAESHGYAARESVGHTLFEMLSWLDQWVKAPKPRM